jgi:hypothetical protein
MCIYFVTVRCFLLYDHNIIVGAWSGVMFVLPKFLVLESCLFQQLEWQLKGSVQVLFDAITKQVEGAIIKQVGQKGKAIPNFLFFVIQAANWLQPNS